MTKIIKFDSKVLLAQLDRTAATPAPVPVSTEVSDIRYVAATAEYAGAPDTGV